jgi:thioredoxin 1
MDNENATEIKKRMALKIIIPILLVSAVIGIWAVKNNRNTPDSAIIEKPGTFVSDKSNLTSTANPDFALHVTEKIDIEKLKSYGLPILIDFGADSCIPCKEMAPVLKELNAELQGKAIVKFVDVWKYQDFAEGYPVSVIPTQILIDSNGNPYKPKNPESQQMKQYTSKATGELVFTAHEGGMTKEQILNALKEMGLK